MSKHRSQVGLFTLFPWLSHIQKRKTNTLRLLNPMYPKTKYKQKIINFFSTKMFGLLNLSALSTPLFPKRNELI